MLTLRALCVMPIDGPLIIGGEVVVDGDLIVEVRPRSRLADHVIDFGQAILMPGLVNAHSHLEYTVLRGFLEDVAFFAWIRALTAMKAHLSRADWEISAKLGALECIAAGITTIGDNTDAGVTALAAIESGLRAVVYQEVFGIDHREPVEPLITGLKDKVNALRSEIDRSGAGARMGVGVSPHAPYTIRPELFAALREYAGAEELPMSIHVAESPAESELIEHGTGPFGEMLARRGILWRTPSVSPTRYVFDQGILGPKSVAVHCVHQSDEDIALIAQSGAAIVHCPKSNAKLGAGIAPLAKWLDSELTVGLGTDSAVSNNTLDLFEEMRFALFLQRAAREQVEGITARQIVQMATGGGAKALGLDDKIGALTPGRQADVIAVRLDSPHIIPARDPYSALVYSARAEDVCFTLGSGKILYERGEWHTLNKDQLAEQATIIRSRAQSAARHSVQ
ncbi:MAG TPA: amidohydrolase family protein [Capsulimonadaceae bacterium]|nr:amidohydrolase family protein [Capsulimonadaceae bacterium]